MLKKQMRVARGTARRLRREAAKQVFHQGKGFSIYWNGGKPTPKSLEEAIKFRNEERQAA